MKGIESFHKILNTNPAEAVKILDEGRMSLSEKKEYLEEHRTKFFQNTDFVNVNTYIEIFENLDLEGKTVINVGAGYAIGGKENNVSPLVEALNEINPHMTFIPIDYNFERNGSWLLLETTETQDTHIHLEPITADATALPFSENSIDGYVSNNLINEPREIETEVSFVMHMFEEAYRVLKPGGFIMVNSFGYFWWKLNDNTVIYNDNIDLDEIVEKEKVESLLEKVGFSRISTIALDDVRIQNTVEKRLKRRSESKGDVRNAGVCESCAFLAFK